jgi:hypothetical protein
MELYLYSPYAFITCIRQLFLTRDVATEQNFVFMSENLRVYRTLLAEIGRVVVYTRQAM